MCVCCEGGWWLLICYTIFILISSPGHCSSCLKNDAFETVCAKYRKPWCPKARMIFSAKKMKAAKCPEI